MTTRKGRETFEASNHARCVPANRTGEHAKACQWRLPIPHFTHQRRSQIKGEAAAPSRSSRPQCCLRYRQTSRRCLYAGQHFGQHPKCLIEPGRAIDASQRFGSPPLSQAVSCIHAALDHVFLDAIECRPKIVTIVSVGPPLLQHVPRSNGILVAIKAKLNRSFGERFALPLVQGDCLVALYGLKRPWDAMHHPLQRLSHQLVGIADMPYPMLRHDPAWNTELIRAHTAIEPSHKDERA
jgi:hypothetical protein